MQFQTRLCATLTIVFTLFGLPALAVADQLKMKNGDVITGEISKIEDGKVYISPAYADEIGVSLADVEFMDSDREFEVKLADGATVSGATVTMSEVGEQTLVVDGEPEVIALADITAAGEPEPWYSRVSHADLNWTWNSGTTDSSNGLIFVDTLVNVGAHRHLAELTIRRDETDGVATKEQDLFNYNYNWLLSGPWYIGATGSYERDPIKDLKYRYTLGGLVGRDLIDDSNTFLTISGGVGYTDQEQDGVSDSGASALWNFRWEQKLRDGDLAMFHNHNINYQFFGDNNLIFKSNTGFRFDIIADVYTSLTFRYDYETEPAPGKTKDDTTLAIGIGSEF